MTRNGDFNRQLKYSVTWRINSPVRLKLIKGKFRQDTLALTPFVVKSKQQPIKVRSTTPLLRTNGVGTTYL